ncbi:serine/threonine phosphatase [Spirochaetia bacterium]|nr:serine/threonine phosphatase [Spirochaetia bacterium]
MHNLCTDFGFVSLNKHGEQLCGDHVEFWDSCGSLGKLHSLGSLNFPQKVVVLADGLGSGVKANILSTLTAKIICTMMANSLTVEECVSTIAATLPVCKERQIAYSTFTIIRVTGNQEAEIIQYDNPQVILLRDGKNFDYQKISETIGNKTIYKTKLTLRENDTFISMSDGAIHAGIGPKLNLNWEREQIIAFMERIYDESLTAKTLSSLLINKCYSLYGGEPGDDTTVCTVKIRPRQPVNLLIGPPSIPNDLAKMMGLFFGREGKHIVCGGTTSALAAEYLHKPLISAASKFRVADRDIPPTAKIEGVDLVTEGVITLRRAVEYARDYLKDNENYTGWIGGEDGASQIARLLFEEATDINFFVGKAVNPAHQADTLSIGFSLKIKLIEELAACLQSMGKRLKILYF